MCSSRGASDCGCSAPPDVTRRRLHRGVAGFSGRGPSCPRAAGRSRLVVLALALVGLLGLGLRLLGPVAVLVLGGCLRLALGVGLLAVVLLLFLLLAVFFLP